MATATVYLKLKPRWLDDRLQGFQVEGATKNRPHNTSGPVVKLKLTVPDQAFKPLTYEVTVPGEAVDYSTVIDVETPDEDSDAHT